jgi:hypothetical protein
MKHLLLLSLLFLAGCIGNSLVRKTYYPDGTLKGDLRVNNLKGMVNTSTGSLVFDINDGDFQARLLIVDSNVVADPNSALALGQMIKTGSSNFTPTGNIGDIGK